MKRAGKHLNSQRKAVKEEFFPTPGELIKAAYKQSRELKEPRGKVNPLVRRKAFNASKAKAFGQALQKKIQELSRKFPRIEEMNPFYVDLISAIIDSGSLKKNLAALNASSKVLKKIRSGYGKKIFSSNSTGEADKFLREFEGRACSVVNKLSKPLEELKRSSKKLKELPTIDFAERAVVLTGFPNVGKTTILNRLTKSKAKIAAYEFTTNGINSGSIEIRYERIQVLDTPGLLDREVTNTVEKKAVAALKHLASAIIFVVDPTESGYPLEKQFSLLEHVKKQFPGTKTIVAMNKADIASQEQIKKALAKTPNAVIIGEGKGTQELLQKLEDALI